MPSSLFDENLQSEITLETEATSLPDDLPFHLLLLGDWGGDSEFSSKLLSSRKFIEIDRDEFDDVMRKISPQVNLKFAGSENTDLKLTFESLDDFHPDGIFQRLPLFSALRNIRQKLKKSDTFNEAAREVRSWYASPPEETQQTDNHPSPSIASLDSQNLLDQILDNYREDSLPDENSYKSPLSKFISGIIAPYILKTDLDEQSRLLAIVDEVISDIMRRILHHKDFQSLESTWRGLYFLVRRVETNNQLKIFFAQLKKEELLDNLSSVNTLQDSQLYQWLINSVLPTGYNVSLAAVCGNYKFNQSVEDTAALIRIAKIAAVANSPFISQINPQFFEMESFSNLPEGSNWKISLENPDYKLWSALRSVSESNYLGLAFPRFIGRLPYGSNTEPIENFAFDEFDDQIQHENYLWINSSFAYAFHLAKEFTLNSWSFNQNNVTDIENLPLHIYETDEITLTKPCAEINMTESAYSAFTEQGIMPLISFRNEDKLRLSALRSISLESSVLKGKWK